MPGGSSGQALFGKRLRRRNRSTRCMVGSGPGRHITQTINERITAGIARNTTREVLRSTRTGQVVLCLRYAIERPWSLDGRKRCIAASRCNQPRSVLRVWERIRNAQSDTIERDTIARGVVANIAEYVISIQNNK